MLRNVSVYVGCTAPYNPVSGVHLKTEQGAGLFRQHARAEGAQELGSRGPAKAVRIGGAG